MPTGYTHRVADGKVTTLREFAMLCARAFGATISMRDTPTDTPIPEKFEASTYHRQELVKARAKLARLERMSPIEAQREMQQNHSSAMACWRDSSIRDAQQRARYLAMIEQVTAWHAPTPEHAGLKDFMLQQLRDSMKFDCGGKYLTMPRLQRWPEWLSEQIIKTAERAAYHASKQADDDHRAMMNTDWVCKLRQSLPE